MNQTKGNRGRIEISAAILKVALNGARKSHIVYQANLNFQLGNKYLDRLINTGLITVPDAERYFTTTDKGVEYINYFEGFKHYITLPEIS